ncbi:nucleotidyltransferase family protein [Rhizobium pisi]|uniref:Nucleotidyltransferase family protein n=2 Tax=Rhizobium pisi TaxID=574561 RepID=A0A427MC00_9HYPH|nr:MULTISPECIES: nucleotidyltransferase family protein [Rhizobium]RSB64775.1 nucleotidyltransferase family protein [Rhizobium pisi]TAV45418.1 nucleotidyltransferase family protein [Rhizobium leguminosarum]TAV45976.1 nucleotidyltransferase family protein [Rhizobium leguminosarum]TAV63831.1 nucleotidyltransferase family protein [Rhizobium leguminosarum]TAX87659.1 nucleotidyltransferase family protein [Rhizobium leguminosarum]
MRVAPTSAKRFSVAVVLLAAGTASRMGEGGKHKLLAEFDNVPLVRRSAIVALGSGASSVAVVVGHRHDEISAALSGIPVETIYNPHYRNGMATSLIAGFSASKVMSADGVLIMLADMPGLTADHLAMLIQAFENSGGKAIVRATFHGKRGNPTILPQSLRVSVMELKGDIGARQIIQNSGVSIIEVEIGAAASLDVDTVEDLIIAGGKLTR